MCRLHKSPYTGQVVINLDPSIFLKDDVERLAYEISENQLPKNSSLNIDTHICTSEKYMPLPLVTYACRFGAIKCFDLLMNSGYDVKLPHDYRLHFACMSGSIEMLRKFDCNSQTCNKKDLHGYTPLHYAAKYGSIDIVQYLFSKGADFSIKNEVYEYPIDYAIEYGFIDIVKFIFETGVMRDYKPIHALKRACKYCHENIAAYIIFNYISDISSIKELILRSGFLALYLKLQRYNVEVTSNDIDIIIKRKHSKFIKYFRANNIPFRNLTIREVLEINDPELVIEYAKDNPMDYLINATDIHIVALILDSFDIKPEEEVLKCLLQKDPIDSILVPRIKKIAKNVSQGFIDGLLEDALQNGFSPIFPFIKKVKLKEKLKGEVPSNFKTLVFYLEKGILDMNALDMDVILSKLNENKHQFCNEENSYALAKAATYLGSNLCKNCILKDLVY